MHAATVPASELPPACADFPDPEPLPCRESPNPAGAGMHNAVRGISSGHHHRSTNPYPMVPDIGAVARTSHGRRAESASVSPRLREAPWPSGWPPRSLWSRLSRVNHAWAHQGHVHKPESLWSRTDMGHVAAMPRADTAERL